MNAQPDMFLELEKTRTVPLPTVAQAKRKRDRAIKSLSKDALFLDLALEAIERYAHRHEFFLVEDVRESAAGIIPHDSRAWGAAVKRAARAGIIEKAGFAEARSSNLSPKVKWRSKVYS